MDLKNVIIMSDLDGTLLTDDKRISDSDLEAIARFRRNGGLFTAATGRGVAMAKRVIDIIGIDIPCVIFNGAAVYDFTAKKFLWQSSMPKAAAEHIIALEKAFPDIGIEILHSKYVYVTDLNKTVEEHMAFEKLTPVRCTLEEAPKDGWLKVLIAYPPEKIDAVVSFTEKNCTEGVNWVRSAPMYYEMLPKDISKGYGYKKLLELMGWKDKFTVAAGDFGNDLDMIKTADLGIAVANAQEAVKQAAKLIVSDNNSSPMTEIIEYLEKLDR